jgi:hypothetical protein
MTDYYPLIARAVAGLPNNTGEARRTIYERARSALVDQLRGLDPPLAESEITRQRLALEESIRKVEAEAARRHPSDPRRTSPPPPGKSTNGTEKRQSSAKEQNEVREVDRRPFEPAAPHRPGGVALKSGLENPPAEPSMARVSTASGAAPAPLPGAPAEPAPLQAEGPLASRDGRRALFSPDREAAAGKSLKGRDVTTEVEAPGDATSQGAKPAGGIHATLPSDAPGLERIDPALRSPARDPPDRIATATARGNGLSTDGREAFHDEVEPPPVASRSEGKDIAVRRSASARALGAAVLAVIVVLGLGAALYWQSDRMRGLMGRNPASPPPQETARPQTKIPDRVSQGIGTATPGQSTSPDQSVGAVAQRVVLYEEDPGEPQGKRYVGSVIWGTESAPSSAGQSPEVAVRANLEIPERRMNMTMSVHRNTDKALPASHTIEIAFNLPPDFPFGGIANVPGVLMKQAEQTRGAPLAGLAVKVTAGFFLLGLSSADTDMQRNLQLLKERSWFDIPVVYGNGRRAILAVEKGTPGEQAFNEAFAAWGE